MNIDSKLFKAYYFLVAFTFCVSEYIDARGREGQCVLTQLWTTF